MLVSKLVEGTQRVRGQVVDAGRIVRGPDVGALVHAPRSTAGELARADARYRPFFGDLDTVRAHRLIEISHEALDGLEPQVVVNRWISDGTIRMIERAEPFPTILTGRPRSAVDIAERAAKWVNARSSNIYGGDTPGGTVFGAVQFAPPGTPGRTRGISSYGHAAFDLSSRVTGQATVTARDSFLTSARPAPWSRLGDVIAERIARDHGFIDDLRAPRTSYRSTIESGQDVVERQRALLRMIDGPRDVAVAAVGDRLRSPLATANNHFIEVQMRDAGVDDIVRWQLEPQDQVVRTAELLAVPGHMRGPARALPDPANVDRLRAATSARGIVEIPT